MPTGTPDLEWPPYTAVELISFWKHRELRYKLRKHPRTEAEQRAIVVARQQDVHELPLEERGTATRFLATLGVQAK